MHDQPKVKEVEPDEAEKRERLETVNKFRAIRDEAMRCRAEKAYTREALAITQKLLDINPENYTICAFRRNILMHIWDEQQRSAEQQADGAASAASSENSTQPPQPHPSPSTKDADLIAELEFSTRILTKEYKCYCAWLHRKWIINELSPQLRIKVLNKENGKCEALLKADERNFHAWGYRRWITGLLREAGCFSDEHEMTFALGKIEHNFSNYSAWHNRALVLGKRLDALRGAPPPVASDAVAATGALAKDIEAEADLVVRAYFCDPNDQSSWFYGEWVLRAAADLGHLMTAENSTRDRVERQFSDAADELIGCEPEAKWPYWLKLKVLQQRHARGGAGEGEVEEMRRLKLALAARDPMHAACYAL